MPILFWATATGACGIPRRSSQRCGSVSATGIPSADRLATHPPQALRKALPVSRARRSPLRKPLMVLAPDNKALKIRWSSRLKGLNSFTDWPAGVPTQSPTRPPGHHGVIQGEHRCARVRGLSAALGLLDLGTGVGHLGVPGARDAREEYGGKAGCP